MGHIRVDSVNTKFENIDLSRRYKTIHISNGTAEQMYILDGITDTLVIGEIHRHTFFDVNDFLNPINFPRPLNPAKRLVLHSLNEEIVETMLSNRERIVLGEFMLDEFSNEIDFSNFKNTVVELKGGNTIALILVHYVRELYGDIDLEIPFSGNVVDSNIRSITTTLWKDRQTLVEQYLDRDVTSIVGEYLFKKPQVVNSNSSTSDSIQS